MIQLSKQPKSRQLWITGLLLVVIFVVFILPYHVSKPWITDDAAQPAVSANPDILAPSAIAEKTQYRQQSQSLLASIITIRDELQAKSVEQWADLQFQQSMDLLAVGDNDYSHGNYDQSLNSYREALAQLQQLQQLAEDSLEQALTDARIGIESAHPSAIPKVLSAASLALAIAPDNRRAQRLNKQASKFANFVDVIQQADKLFYAQQYQAAKKIYQRALVIEPDHQKAQASLLEVDSALDKQNFLSYMSNGYAALDTDNFERALAAFNSAGAIHVNDPSVEQAIAHVTTRRSQIWVDQQMAEVAELEQQEEWQRAQLAYQKLLQTDPTLIQAKARLVTVKIRADLDSAITSILNDPFILAHQAPYTKAQKLLADAEKIDSAGAKLQGQTRELRTVIQRARIAVDIRLKSDNLTQVTLFRIAKLGTFQHRTLALFPGRYIVSGSRKGYRDVRVEFTVEGAPLSGPIRISCTERI